MSKNPSETLRHLFAIAPQRILDDIRLAQEDLPAVENELSALRAIPSQARTSQIEARRAHLRLIETHELCRRENISPEVQTFYAALGASYVAQDAEMVSGDQDRCAELLSEMNAIRRREGYSEEDGLLKNEGPEDYRRLNDQYEQLLDRISDTVFAFVLRLYQLEYYADLFERDRVEFEIQREIGRRAIMPGRDDTEAAKLMDDYFRRKYGKEAFNRVVARGANKKNPITTVRMWCPR